jgi:hypothetical protein
VNSAGLPGTGIGGLLYILLALCMPFFEPYQTILGRTSLERWKLVLRQLAITLLILAGTGGTFVLSFELFGLKISTALMVGNAELITETFFIATLVISLSLLTLVLVGIRIWALVEVINSRRGKEPYP